MPIGPLTGARRRRRMPVWGWVALAYVATLVLAARVGPRPTYYRVHAVASGVLALAIVSAWLRRRRRARINEMLVQRERGEPWWSEFAIPLALTGGYTAVNSGWLATGRPRPLWLILLEVVPAVAIVVTTFRVVRRELWRAR